MNFKTLTNASDIKALINYHNTITKYCVLDFETTGLDPHKDKILDIQMQGRKDDEAFLFDAKYLPLLKDITVPHVFHNFAFDWHMAYTHGVDFRGKTVFDTMLMHHLYDENKRHDLDSIIQEHWGDNYKEEFWAKYDAYELAPESERLVYACKDIVYTNKLYIMMVQELVRQEIPSALIDHVHNLATSLFNTQIEGVRLDTKYVVDLGQQFKTKIELIQKDMYESVAPEIARIEADLHEKKKAKYKTAKGQANAPKPKFNFDSTQNLQALLYQELGLPIQKNEKTKAISTDDASLEKIEHLHSLVPKLREYRENIKIYGTYIEGMLERVKDGVIFPSFKVNGTVTGRISHSDPNLGNMPRAGGIRAMFIPREGYCLIGADYSQLEICIGAHFTRDKNLLKIVLEGASQHDITAQGLGIQRQQAKTVNFAMMYGASAYKIAKTLDVPFATGQKIWNKYWETYPGVYRVMQECKSKVDKGVPIVNPFGRRRRFEVKKREDWDSAYRQAFNALIQGTGADCCNRAFYIVNELLRNLEWGRGMFTIHDELLIEVKKEVALEAETVLRSVMVDVGKEINLTVPLTVDSSGPMNAWLD